MRILLTQIYFKINSKVLELTVLVAMKTKQGIKSVQTLQYWLRKSGNKVALVYLLTFNKSYNLGQLAHLASQFACNTTMIVNASSNPPLSRVKLL